MAAVVINEESFDFESSEVRGSLLVRFNGDGSHGEILVVGKVSVFGCVIWFKDDVGVVEGCL